ncbi:MAG: CBS domain-containing protein [Actinobacteria bacterium]|nr:CBS domain-containing protein [Actinomycetota bacterium]
MEIGPLVTRAVLTIKESDTLRDAATWMMERGVGSAVVITDGKPSGIITDRDTLKAIAQGANGGRVTVDEFLTRKLATATESMELMDAARVMRDRGFRHLVVVDDGGALVGVFSMRDLVVGLLQEISASA